MGYIPPPPPRDPRLLPAYIAHLERAAKEERAKFDAMLPVVLAFLFATAFAAAFVLLGGAS